MQFDKRQEKQLIVIQKKCDINNVKKEIGHVTMDNSFFFGIEKIMKKYNIGK